MTPLFEAAIYKQTLVNRLTNEMKILFVCSQNLLRSPTAEVIFSSSPGVETLSAGINDSAKTPISAELIVWADIVFVMEKSHRDRLKKKFRSELKAKRLVVLDIPDKYDYMDPELVRILTEKVPRYVPIIKESA